MLRAQSIDDDQEELPEWLTSLHGDCPAPSSYTCFRRSGRIEWPCGLEHHIESPPATIMGDSRLQGWHDEAFAKAETELREQHGVVRMRASRISSGPMASGGVLSSSGGFAAPMAPTYDFPSVGEAGAEAVMPAIKAGRGSIQMEMTVTPEGASWIKQLWEQSGRQRS